jgi:predicted house-cleaning NTP pyrophosphatase (Maf/HAM1 superfamily)
VLLLASASPARRRLLQQAAIPHRVRVSGLDDLLRQRDTLRSCGKPSDEVRDQNARL